MLTLQPPLDHLDPQWHELIERAITARGNAYCDYSGYAVGAAVLDSEGNIFSGANVENASYGATICAERSAVCQMVAQGGRTICRVAIATADGGPPCGICLQVLMEFQDRENDMQLALISRDQVKIACFHDHFPFGFSTFEHSPNMD
jgi:cytidine deaminase